ncbi:hypothetical protein N7466_005639 [Penicillium verhagenii]|uniref:uncharacterized protein n=1 Tax=Penicillium verhagenii TaxID=1562060 RepID=UPI0025455F44|nr:uncharacterized protein N7466_005639 [Penicillium verhagenii]KAJ5930146.1 hypothetical protein N7466_005639 [Penicillium verhagenii]
MQAAVEQATEAPVKKFTRHSKACRECRRLRTRCVNDGRAPCQSCRQSGKDCVFLQRGQPDQDRAFRRPRARTSVGHRKIGSVTTVPTSSIELNRNSQTSKSPASSPAPATRITPASSTTLPSELREVLPPFEELIEGVNIFTTSFFQLGFLPKTLIFERLRKDPDSISRFLLFSILSISARFTPCLVTRYGSDLSATDLFLSRAAALVPEQMYVPTLEATQGFFLLSIAEWGKGDKHRSSMHMSIAMTMAGILRLHREETYRLSSDATAEQFVHAEAGRRTFWMLESYNNLLSGLTSPVAISYSDITALLPCTEHEFAFGNLVNPRVPLTGTLPALKDPSLAHSATRSLFATLLQTHNLWGQVARVVGTDTGREPPDDEVQLSREDYARLSTALDEFERNSPTHHCWSIWNLRGFKAKGLDLAYLSAVMVLRLSNIVLRRRYLHDGSNSDQHLRADHDPHNPASVTTELFENMIILHEQIDAFFDFRSPDQGFPALIVFCVYVCGSLANHLHKRPEICPSTAPRAEEILRKSLTGLGELQHAWPLARRWNKALCRASARDPNQITEMHLTDLTGNSSLNGPFTPGSEAQSSSPRILSRLNDPFPTDVMLMEFETYPWNEIFMSSMNLDYANVA